MLYIFSDIIKSPIRKSIYHLNLDNQALDHNILDQFQKDVIHAVRNAKSLPSSKDK